MPPVAIGAIAAGIGAGFAVGSAVVAGSLVIGFSFGAFLVGASLSLAIGVISQALQPSAGGGFGGAPRTVNVTDPVTSRRIIVGEIRIGGPRIYFTTTENNKILHLVVAHAGHEVHSFREVLVSGEPVTIDEDGSETGEAGSLRGRFAGFAQLIVPRFLGDNLNSHARIKVHTGASGQLADADLVAEVAEWTSAHVGNGIAYTYGRFRYNKDLFDKVPEISAVIRGLKVYDPRDGGTRWTRNPALIKRWYLTDAEYGLGTAVAEIDDASVIEAANIDEEMVAVVQTSDNFSAAEIKDCSGPRQALRACQAALAAGEVSDCTAAEAALTTCETPTLAGYLWRGSMNSRWLVGDRVQLTTTGTLPAPLATGTDYYVIPRRILPPRDRTRKSVAFQAHLADFIRKGWDIDEDDDETQITIFALASSYANALADVAITISDIGSGVHTVTRTGEPRYTCDGMIDSAAEPEKIMAALNTADAGAMIKKAGKWFIHSGAWRTPETQGLAEDDLRGPVRASPLVSRQDLANGVKGLFVDPYKSWAPQDFPPVTSETFKARDGGRRLWREMDLAFTLSPSMAQRLAKIELLRGRQQLAAELPCKLTAFNIVPGDIVPVSNDIFGWAAKNFEVISWGLAIEDSGGVPMLGVDLALRETDASIFDWTTDEESAIDPAPNTILGNPFIIPQPGDPSISESLYVSRDGAGVKARAVVSWTAPEGAVVDGYIVEYRLAGATSWTATAKAPDITTNIDDIAPGSYEFRVLATNDYGGFSDYSEVVTKEIQGLLAPPAALTGLSIAALSAIAILRWDRSADLDVRIGGRIRVRHSPALTGATWAAATEVSDPLPGDATQAMVPLRAGTYLLRPYDSSGIPSAAIVTASSKAAEHLTFANVDTVTEHSTFPGTHNNTVVAGGVLKLAGAGLFDDIPDFDAVSSLDGYGGAALSGTYSFAGGMDFTTVKTVRLTANVTASAINTLDLIDDRTTNIDSWDDIDGADSADGDLQVWFRETDDDPAASPTWSAWRRLTAADVNARGLEFEARLTTRDQTYNLHCTALSVTAEEIV